MKDFLFLFRADYVEYAKRSPEELQSMTKKWMDWIGGIAAQNKLADRGNRLETGGLVIRPGNLITDGPFCEIKESLGGYIVVKTATMDEATEIAQGCPVYEIGGSLEIREISVM